MKRIVRALGYAVRLIDGALNIVGLVTVGPFVLAWIFFRDWLDRQWPDTDRGRAARRWVSLCLPFLFPIVMLALVGYMAYRVHNRIPR